MWKFFQSLQFSHWTFLVAAIATILTLIGSFIQMKKDLNEEKDALNTEKKRTEEFQKLLNKSNTIQETTQEALYKATIQLEKTELILNTQKEVIDKSIAINNQLTGTDKIPKLIMTVSSIMGSPTDYLISFSISNPDDYPCYDLALHIIEIPAKNHPLRMTGRKTKNELTLEDHLKWQQNQPHGSFVIPRHETKSVAQLQRKFRIMNDNTAFSLDVKWSKGSFHVYGNLMINNYKPQFVFPPMSITNRTDFEFVNQIDDNMQQEIQRNYHLNIVEEQKRRDLEKLDGQH